MSSANDDEIQMSTANDNEIEMSSDDDDEIDEVIDSELSAPATCIDIAPEGDVILVVGPQQIRLRVHSLILRTASKVFNSMFGPNWSEGQGLSAQNPPEVSLKEDDANALRIIFLVLHHRNTDMEQNLTTIQTFKIAVASDKYDLTVALKHASTQWLKVMGGLSFLEMGHLLAAAFLFKDTHAFASHTLQIMLHSNDDYSELRRSTAFRELIPFEVICTWTVIIKSLHWNSGKADSRQTSWRSNELG